MNENRFVGPTLPSGDNHATSNPIASWSGMMMKTNLYARSGAAAIAAVLALSSTPALTQEADPAAAEPAESLSTTTAPAEEPAATEAPAAPTTAAEPAPAAKPAPVKRTATVKKATAAKTVAATAAAARPEPRVAPAEPAAPAPAVASVDPVPPIVTPESVESPPAEPVAAAEPAGIDTEEAAMLGGGALALLALGGAALAMRRRRRHAEEDAWEYEAYEPVAAEAPTPVPAPQPVVAPAPMAAPVRPEPVLELNNGYLAPAASAFAWGNTPATARPAPKADPIADDDGSDRRPGESWVERAQRGPSPANPSVSLKNRLRRAAFFDKRERDVAAGTAVPIEADAGLPDNMDDPQIATQQRELQPA